MRIWIANSSIPRQRAHPGFTRQVNRLALLMGREYPGQVRRILVPRRRNPANSALTIEDWLSAVEIEDDVPDWRPVSTTAERLREVRAVAGGFRDGGRAAVSARAPRRV